MNAAVALARRPCHHRHAGVEQIFAGEFEIGVTTTEQFREQLLEPRIDAVEGLFETRAGLSIDLADRLFQRRQRFADVLMLGIEVGHALALFLKLVDRREVDRAETLDTVAQVLGPRLPCVDGGVLRHILL